MPEQYNNAWWDPRIFNPRAPGGTPTYTGEPIETGTSTSFDPRELLGYFGQKPVDPRQNIFLPEPGSDNWFGRHPRVSRGIEGAFLGAALTKPGETIGENISNVAQAVLGIEPMRRQIEMQRHEAPYVMAGQIAKLGEARAKLEAAPVELGLKRAQTKETEAQTLEREANTTRISNLTGVPNYEGTKIFDDNYYAYQLNANTGKLERLLAPGQAPPPEGTPTTFQNHAAGKAGGSEVERQAEAMGFIPGTPEFAQQVQDLHLQRNEAMAGFRNQQPPSTASAWTDTMKGYTEQFKQQLHYDKPLNDVERKTQVSARRSSLRTQNPDADFAQLRKQAESEVSAREAHDKRLHKLWTQWNALPIRERMRITPEEFGRQHGYNPETRQFAQPGPMPGAQPPGAAAGRTKGGAKSKQSQEDEEFFRRLGQFFPNQ